MIDPDLEPLAFRVRPQPGECFDSWIGRVAARHEVNRIELFRHLGIETRLARFDLVRGRFGLDGQKHADSKNLVDRLAWVLHIDGASIEATFVSASADMVLPPACRQYGCPQCWHEWLAAEQPLAILREWIFRVSWHCAHHRVLLTDLGPVLKIVGPAGRLRWLADEARRGSQLFFANDYKADLLTLNQRAQAHLQGAMTRAHTTAVRTYLAEFGGNQFHVARSRTFLLACAHSYDRHVPRDFARIFPGLKCPGTAPLPVPADGKPAMLNSLVSAIVTVNRHRLRGKVRKLNAITRRLGQFAYLHAEKPGAWQLRARYQLECERRQRQSEVESLKSLQAALKFSIAAQERRCPSDLAGPSGFPSAWGLVMPSVSRLNALIEAHPATSGPILTFGTV